MELFFPSTPFSLNYHFHHPLLSFNLPPSPNSEPSSHKQPQTQSLLHPPTITPLLTHNHSTTHSQSLHHRPTITPPPTHNHSTTHSKPLHHPPTITPDGPIFESGLTEIGVCTLPQPPLQHLLKHLCQGWLVLCVDIVYLLVVVGSGGGGK